MCIVGESTHSCASMCILVNHVSSGQVLSLSHGTPENRLIREKKQEISTPLQIALMPPPTRPWQKDERAQYVCCHEARAFVVCFLP